MFKGAAYLCNSKLCSLLDQRQRLVGLVEAQEPGIVYQGHIANKRAPGMEFLGKRSQKLPSYNVPVINKRAPGKSSSNNNDR